MFKSLFSTSLVIATTLVLAACGGGSDRPCGENSQSFAINFAVKTYDIKLGQATELKSTVTPESCRFDITFEKQGSLPIGMTLVNGNVVGTPTKTGTYEFVVQIRAVTGYQPIVSLTGGIQSSLITVKVSAPVTPTP